MSDRWEDYFDPDETLLWEGQPMPRRGINPLTIGLAAFGMPFFLAGLGMSGGAILSLFDIDIDFFRTASSVFLFFFGLPFLGAGAAMLFGPWYVQREAHRVTRYALTDRRAYIATKLWSKKLEAVPIHPEGTVTLVNGHSVYFRTEQSRDTDGDKTTEQKGFEHIADADKVYRMIRNLQDKLPARRDE